MAKNSRLSLIVTIIFIALLILVGCDPNESTSSKTGSIEIVLANNVRARGFQPEISMEIHSYEISGTGPSDATIEPITLNEGTKVISGLIPGAWDITVKGYNEEGDEIGKGVLPVTIIAGHTLRRTILVEEIGGKGMFSLTLDLPEDQTTIKKVKLTFLQEDGESIDFTSAQPEEWSSARPLVATVIDSGFHALSVQLYDENERLIWGETYTVRIVKGTQTEALITITEDDLATFGGLDLTIIDGMPVLFTVGLSATKDLVGLGEAVTFTATPSLSGGTYAYWWFVDGQRVEDETSKTLTLSDELAIGRHNVSVVAIRAGVMASASKIIIKTDEQTSPGIFIRLTSKNDQSDVREFSLLAGLTGNLAPMGTSIPGKGTPLGVRQYSSEDNSFEFTWIIATERAASLDEITDTADFQFAFILISLEDSGCVSQTINSIGLFDYTVLFPESTYRYIDTGESSESPSVQMSITSFGDVGDIIVGTITADTIRLHGWNDGQESEVIGDFTLEIQFMVERYPDVVFYDFDGEDLPAWADGLYPEEIIAIVSELGTLPTEEGVLFLAPNVVDTPNASVQNVPDDFSYHIIIRNGSQIVHESNLSESEFSRFIPLPSGQYRLNLSRYKGGVLFDSSNLLFSMTENQPTVVWLDYLIGFSSSSGYLQNMKTQGMNVHIQSEYPLSSSMYGTVSPADFFVDNGYVHSITSDYCSGCYNYNLVVRTNSVTNTERIQISVCPKNTILVDGKRKLSLQKFASFSIQPLYFETVTNATYLDQTGNLLTDGMYFVLDSAFAVNVHPGSAFAGWVIPNNIFYKKTVTPEWPYGESFALTNQVPKPIIVSEQTPHIESIFFDRVLYSLDNYGMPISDPLGTETLKIQFSEPVKSSLNDGQINSSNFTIEGASVSEVSTENNMVAVTVDSFIKGPLTLKVQNLISTTTNTPVGGQTEFQNAVVEVSVINDTPEQGTINTSCEGLYLNNEYFPIEITPTENYKIAFVEIRYLPSGRNTRSGCTDYGESNFILENTESYALYDITVHVEYLQRP